MSSADLQRLLELLKPDETQCKRELLYKLVQNVMVACKFKTQINLGITHYDVLNKAREEIWKLDSATVEKVLSEIRDLVQ